MQYKISIKINSIYLENELHDSFSYSDEQSLRECVMSYLLENDINFDGCSVIFYDITKELLSRSKVTFLNQEPLDDVLDVAVCEISDMFDFEQLHLSIGIGGIGVSALAEIAKSQGITVTGSDMKSSEVTDLLERNNIINKLLYNLQKSNNV